MTKGSAQKLLIPYCHFTQ